MAQEIFYQVSQADQPKASDKIAVPFIVGRQEESEPGPVRCFESDRHRKLVIAELTNRSVPRLSLEVSLQNGTIIARNMHPKIELMVSPGRILPPGERIDLEDDGTIFLPDRYQVRFSVNQLESSYTEENGRTYHVLLPSSKLSHDVSATKLLSMLDENSPDRGQAAVDLVRVALSVFQETPGSEKFFNAAVRSALQMIEVDRVCVLMKEKSEWTIKASAVRPTLDPRLLESRIPSRTLLNKMERARQTVYVEPQSGTQSLIGRSMVAIERAVASPIFNGGQVIGALYGDRSIESIDADKPIGDLENMLLQVLAGAVSSGLAVEREQQMRSSLSLFFSDRVLEQLEDDSRLLEGQDTEVSVLFCDVRGFSAVTERAGPQRTIEWINDVLTVLSECVLEQDGVLVDYIGDELMAMWGAPGNQTDHAIRACHAAQNMLAQLNPLAEKWQDLVNNRFGFGIGINSGPARVGNTGSRIKFKYGPLGNTVNLASRVQGISKQIGVPGLITGSTAAAATAAGFLSRRLTKVRVVGIKEPIELFELLPNNDNEHRDLCRKYEQALTAYENEEFNKAAGFLASLVQVYPHDRPTIILLSRTVELLTASDQVFDPVWCLKNK